MLQASDNIYIYIYIYIDTHLIEHYGHFLSTYFFVNPFEGHLNYML